MTPYRKHHLSTPRRDALMADLGTWLAAADEAIVAAYVFGSFIGEAPFADIDVGLLTRDGIKDSLDFELRMEIELQDAFGYPFDVRILNGAPIGFSQHVFRTGRLILDRDPNFRADRMGLVLKKYFDFARFRRRYLEEALNGEL